MATNLVSSPYQEEFDPYPLRKSLRLGAVSLLLLAGWTVYDTDYIDLAYGIVLITAVILAWKFTNPAMYLVLMVVMSWSAFSNILSLVFGEGSEKLWSILGVVEIVWIVLVNRQYKKYRYLHTANEALVLRRFSLASAVLAMLLVVLTPVVCAVFFSSTSASSEVAQAASAERIFQFLGDPAVIALSFLPAMAVFTLGLSLSVEMNEKSGNCLAGLGMIVSIFTLAGILFLVLIGAIGELTT